MRHRRPPFALALVIGLTLLFGMGCSTNSEVPADEMPTEETDEKVDSDTLADHPCGDADWDEPPPDVTSLED